MSTEYDAAGDEWETIADAEYDDDGNMTVNVVQVTRSLADCEEWKPIGNVGGNDRSCLLCGDIGNNHRPTAFMRGLGLPADAAKRSSRAVADSLRDDDPREHIPIWPDDRSQ